MPLNSKIKKHEEGIYKAAFAAAAAGVPGAFIPTLDLVVVGSAWAVMLIAIADNSNRQLDHNTALKFATAILSGAAAYLGGTKVLTFALHAIPGLGTMTAVGINSLLNFIYTCRLGRFIALQMAEPEFDTGDWSAMIPELTAMVFAAPSILEIKEAWKDWSANQQYKQ